MMSGKTKGEGRMNFHYPAQPCCRPRVNSRFLQQLDNQQVTSRSVDRKLWLSVGKVLLVLCPMVLAVNLWLASSFKNLEQSVQALENVSHQLMENHISLRAQRDQVFSPERVRIIAAEKLSLYAPEKEQMKFF